MSSSLGLMQGLTVRPRDRIRKPDPLLRVFVHCSSGFQNPTSTGPFPQCPPLFPSHLHIPLCPHPSFCRWGMPCDILWVCFSYAFLLSGGGDRRPQSQNKPGPLLLWVTLGFHCDYRAAASAPIVGSLLRPDALCTLPFPQPLSSPGGPCPGQPS